MRGLGTDDLDIWIEPAKQVTRCEHVGHHHVGLGPAVTVFLQTVPLPVQDRSRQAAVK